MLARSSIRAALYRDDDYALSFSRPLSGNSATVSVTDGGLGDDELTAAGRIVDPVEP